MPRSDRHIHPTECRKFGKQSSLWTLDMAAEVSFEEGLTERRVSGETIRATLKRMGVRWEQAKRSIIYPLPKMSLDRALRWFVEVGERADRRLSENYFWPNLSEFTGSSKLNLSDPSPHIPSQQTTN
jgi:hypothetical protein